MFDASKHPRRTFQVQQSFWNLNLDGEYDPRKAPFWSSREVMTINSIKVKPRWVLMEGVHCGTWLRMPFTTFWRDNGGDDVWLATNLACFSLSHDSKVGTIFYYGLMGAAWVRQLNQWFPSTGPLAPFPLSFCYTNPAARRSFSNSRFVARLQFTADIISHRSTCV